MLSRVARFLPVLLVVVLPGMAAAQDTTPPDSFIDSGPPAGGTITVGSAAFTFHATDVDNSGTPTTGLACSYRLAPIETSYRTPVACTSTPDSGVALYNSLENGSYTFFVRAHDAAGNVDVSPATRAFTVDRGPDPLLENQWHLKSRTIELAGSNVRTVWPNYMGTGVAVGVVDDGLQHTHPDLQANYSSALSWDFNFSDPDPSPLSGSAHGTAVAGVAAARTGNAIGVSGAAPRATLAGMRLLAAAFSDLTEAAAFGHQPDAIHIVNNSWGPTDDGATLEGPGSLAAAAIEQAVRTGRGGLGRIFVWAVGNGRNGVAEADNCNFDGYANSRFVLSVGSVNDQATQAAYSESCSALLVTAPSSDTDPARRKITTTDLVGGFGSDAGDYTSTFGGTSAAAPLVSGTVALMLERRPTLSWRDVKYILRETSSRTAIVDGSANWTPGSLPHSERYGFGLIDAEAAVARAATWTSVPPESAVPAATDIAGIAIPDNNTLGSTRTIVIGNDYAGFVVEHVEIQFSATHPRRGDLQVTLESPSAVTSTLATLRPSDTQANFSSWRFRSVRHWGEPANGTWRLTVADRRIGMVGTLNQWTLRIFGTYRGYVRGRVTAGGAPQPGVTVLVYDNLGALARSASTDSAGDYTVDGLVSGNYRVHVEAPAAYLHQAYNGVTCVAACAATTGQLVAVTEGEETTGINFALTPRAAISGVAPATGSILGGTLVAISGVGFTTPATVTVGGTAATSVTLVSSTSMTAVTPAGAAGAADVTVTFVDQQTATLAQAFTYVTPPPLVLTSVVLSPVSPVQAGTTVTVVAGSTGGTSPQFQFWRYNVGTLLWSLVRDFGASATYTWPAAEVQEGTYVFLVYARSAGSASPFDSSFQTGHFIVTAPVPPVRLTKVSITPRSVIQHGTTMVMTATATGGAGVIEYEFRRVNAGAGDWTVVKPYSVPGATLTWTPGLPEVGGYVFEVRARSEGSTSPLEDAYGSILVVVTANAPAVLTGVSTTPSSPAAAGTSVTWRAHASSGVAPLEYQFWRHHEESQTWSLAQNFSTAATYTWATTASDAGTYVVQARVRSTGSIAAYESLYQTGRFNLSNGPSPAVITSMIPRPSAPVSPGTAVTLTARATGGAAPLEYQFWHYDATVESWVVLRDFSISNTHTWTATAGVHLFHIRVRSTGSTSVDSSWTSPSWFTVASGSPPRLTGVTGPGSTVAAPAMATWTAQATGGGDNEYQFYRYHEQTGLWAMVREYDASASYSWSTAATDAGTYLIQARARRAGSALPFESVFQTGWYAISDGAAAQLTSLTPSTGASVQPGNTVIWTAVSSGAASPEYQFRRLDASTGESAIVQEFGSSAQYAWTPEVTDIGTYKFQVRVRKAGAATYDHWLDSSWFVVSNGAIPAITGVTTSSSPLTVGAMATWTALAAGGVAPLQFQFWRHHLESKTWSLEQDYSASNVFTWVTTSSDPGTYVMQVRARSVGAAAPFESLFDAAAVVVQPLPPETTIESAPAATTLDTSATFTFAASEAGSTFECSLDAAAFSGCVSGVTYTGLSVSAHSFSVRAIGAAGSIDLTPATHAWTIVPPDITPPDTTIDSSPSTSTSTSATFTFSASEGGSTFQCSLDTAPYAACTSPRTYTGLSATAHTFAVKATDLSGNTDLTPATHAWTVLPPDIIPPQTTISSSPPATTISTSATFEFTADEAGSTFECKLDSGSYSACTSPRTYTTLADGAHTFEVRATDGAGNIDLTPATHNWTIVAPDCGSPVTLIATGDSWLEQSSPTSNKGTDSPLKVKSQSGNGNMRALVRFAMPAMTPGCLVQSATLSLFAASATTGRTLNAVRITGSWTESVVTWSNQPATAGTEAAAAAAAASGNVEWTVTSQVQAMYDAAILNGFLVRDATENGPGSEQEFRSREDGQTPPTLEVSFVASSTRSSGGPAAPPPPAPAPLDACAAPMTLSASADAWLDQNSSSTNKGTDTILKVQSKRPRDNFRALLLFPLLPGIPAGCVVESAVLRLYAASGKSGRSLEVLRVTSPWSEDLVTWKSQPRIDHLPAASTASDLGWLEWTVTPHVQLMVAGASNHGWMVRDARENGDAEQQFHARDKGEHPPELVLTLAPAPGTQR